MRLCSGVFAHEDVRRALVAVYKSVRQIVAQAKTVTPQILSQVFFVISELHDAPTLKFVFLVLAVHDHA